MTIVLLVGILGGLNIPSFAYDFDGGRWNEDRTLIYSYITVSVRDSLKWSLDQGRPKEIIARIPGGEVGNIGLKVSDTPQFVEGEEVLLFLTQEDKLLFLVTGLIQGKYTIENGMATNGYLQREIPLKSFVGEISEAVKRMEEGR